MIANYTMTVKHYRIARLSGLVNAHISGMFTKTLPEFTKVMYNKLSL